ncbi:hypothetical protein [Qipengyuania sp. RANM35]|uniref:hypothetical protein n=1 Tax=Qipengyuania sp. RANM35 TaxID=3068635 RepID=UPI0034DB4C7D
MTLAENFAREAEKLVGTSFRLRGRNPATGLDCVGLVSCALSAARGWVKAPDGYALRNATLEPYLTFAGRNGFENAVGSIVRGDLLLVRPGPAQTHLVVATSPDRFVHAHASLGRVAIHAGTLTWSIHRHYRLLPLIEE